MFKDVVYILIIIMLFVGAYVGHQAIQKHTYIVYAPLFVEIYSRNYKGTKDMQAYPAVKNLQDEIFLKKQTELNLKLVTGLIEINQNLHLGGDFRKALDKYKASKNPEQDFYLLREFQESVKFLPPVKWNFSKSLFYFAATSVCVAYDELISLESLKWTFIQKTTPLEPLLNSQRAPARVSQ